MHSPRNEQFFLAILNAFGILLYLAYASKVWLPPDDQEIVWDFGAGLQWFLTALPWLLACAIIDFILFRTIIARFLLYGRWQSLLVLTTCGFAWLGAIYIDFVHH